MVGERLVRTTLAKADDAFGMYLEGRISLMILGVNLDRHARDITPFAPQAGAAVRAIKGRLDGADKDTVRALRKELEAVRGGIDAELGAGQRAIQGEVEAAREAKRVHEAQQASLVRAAEQAVHSKGQDLIARTEAARAVPASASASKAPASATAPDSSGAEPLEEEGEPMSMEEIERILADAKKSL